MILGTETKPSLEQLAHFGIPGMKWGFRKAMAPTSATPVGTAIRKEVTHAATLQAGRQATNAVLKKYGHLIVPAAKSSVKIAAKTGGLLKGGAKVSATSIKVVGSSAKFLVKGGKASLRGALALAKLGIKLNK